MNKWVRHKTLLAKYYWRWLWMSREQRLETKERLQQTRAMIKLMGNLLANAPIDKILAGEGCSWSMTPKQEEGTKEGITEYVKAVKGAK